MRTAILTLFAAAALTASCTTANDEEQAFDLEGPAAYDTHGPVTLRITDAPADLADHHLSIHVPGEGTLFEGNAAYAAEFTVVLKVSPGVTRLRATVRDPNGVETEQWVPVDDHGAILTVGNHNE